ncbi:DUF2844 domain-containing protein [Paraburkholderia graminis]|jgi:Protein of unknown function (DUF2844)|uniref:DUF2844 domain-containing protein n=1 Tax=Paraburkholderia graminis TaxID=60548 RepID=A0ABD5CR83_9BURK|nr:DUF2844 domain-containing protein [Paraburkholderia graminis]AXF07122.1 DUF2844 domain-containing protein [Paraburkholderia graminis]MDQ0622076.1 hypothetical protein [Paraburkholderia graminis]MDR6207745.1 hypothetical protein [Paraburkholderia graminis]MDR6468593.1 hypothetical protein [Paraburkholderia graminis]
MRLIKIAMLAATLLPLSSFAALGGAPVANASAPLVLRAAASQSVSDSASASASASPAASPAAGSQPASAVTATAPYTMRQSVDANGVTIREYLLPANVVFAVTWQGPIRPNMRALLGSYFTNYVAAGQTGVRGSGPLIEGNDDFRIESAGRLGNFSGMAWLPRLLPAGVRPGDLE